MTRSRISGSFTGVALTTAVAAGMLALPRADQTPARGSAPAPPRLVVLIVVDQFRADYVTEYGSQWTQGLRRLFAEGAVFEEATVPYGVTKTCAGFASVSTGTYPSTHGMIDNEWFDGSAGEYVACTLDPSTAPVALAGAPGREQHSARYLRVPTFAESLARQAPQPPAIVALALKPRSAISLAGRATPRSVVVWEEDTGTWATSTAYAAAAPPVIDAFVRGRPATAALGEIWRPLLPASSYRYADDADGEPEPNVFPYPLRAPLGTAFTARWDASPWSDAYLGDMAASVIERQFASGAGTDFLAIGFSALDYIGHNYGPRSHEVQDMLARLDVTVGRLLTVLDRVVGRDRYVLALTSDHGVAPLPEQGADTGAPGGRLSVSAVARAVESALVPIFGRRQLLQAVSGTYVYFAPGVAEQIRTTTGARAAVEKAVMAVPGMGRLYWANDLAASNATNDPLLTSFRRSYVAGRSGDLLFVPAPHWVVATVGTNHGTPYPYDTRVPLVFFGQGIKSARYRTPATTVDVAPTLAALVGFTMTRTDGRVLPEIRNR